MRLVGFIGLGTMGYPMAENLLKQGFEVVAYNRTRSIAERLAEHGAAVADSPRDVARDADVVITMLGDDASVESVYYGANGIFSGLRPGSTMIDCSTVSPGLSRRIAQDAESHLADFLDAPVTGSKPAAENGTLLFMAGGRSQAVEEVRGVLLAMGREIVHMGPAGSGSETKLAHNAMVGIHAAALAEALSMAVKAGLDPEKFLDVVQGGGASSRQAEWKRSKLLSRDFSNQFSLKFMLKDLRLASALSDDLRVPSPMLDSAKQLFQIGEAKGLGELDLCSVIQCYEDWTGVQAGRSEAGAKPLAAVGGDDARERRRSPRMKVDIPLHISVYQWRQEGSFSGQQIEGRLYDLSESGLQLLSSFPLAMDMFVVIHFPQEADLPPITGKIIRIVPVGGTFRYGCMLSGLPPFVRLQLEEYLLRKQAEEQARR